MYMYKPNNMVLDHVVIIDVGSVQVSFYSLLRKLGFFQSVTLVKIIGKVSDIYLLNLVHRTLM